MSDEDMETLLGAVERKLGTGWRDIVEQLRDDNDLDDVAARIHSGDIDGAIRGVEDAAATFATETHAAYVASGQRAAAWLDAKVDDVVRFDPTNDRATAWAKQNKIDLVREISIEQRDLIRGVVIDGVSAGRNPREVAQDLRDSIGLTKKQAAFVDRYRTALRAGDFSDALGRELTDGRDDRSVRAAMNADRTLTPEQIDTMVDRYRSNWVGYRAETIARTEGLRVVHQGTEDLFRQAIDDGSVDSDALTREWNHKTVGRYSRSSHVAMNGQTRAVGEPFVTGDGAEMRYPGDPNADPEETINCRCVVSTRLDI